MDKLFNFFIQRKLFVNIIVVVFIFLGVLALKRTPREGMPSIDSNQLSIVTRYPGASPEDVELNVTCKIEEELKEVDGLTEITSVSIENSSSILVQVDESMGRNKVREIKEDVQKALDRISDLPEEVEDILLTEIKTSDVPVIEIAISHKNREFLRQWAKKLERKIEKLDGVAGVNKIGYYDKEIHIEVDPLKMKQAYVSLPEIVMSIQKRNLRSTSGTLESYKGFKNIVILNKFTDPMDVKDVILRSNFDFKNIVLKQIAEVKIAEKDNHLIVRNNGENGISLVVKKKENSDIIRVINRIKKSLKKEAPGKLKYSFVNDQSRTTRNRLNILFSNGLIGLILVIALLLIFLNRQAALWTAFGIPFCFIAVFIFFAIFNITINAVSLAGFIVVLGMLVDDAIVVAEKTAYYRELGINPAKASLKAVREMAGPVFAAALTSICAYFPMFFLGGRAGKFIWNIPIVVIIALAISLLECFFILPNHLSHGSIKIKPKAAWIKNIENIYKKLLVKVLKVRYVLISVFVITLIGIILIAKFNLKFQMFPQSGIDTFYINIEGPKDQSIEDTEKTVIEIEKIVATLPEKELLSYTSRVGHHSISKTKDFGDHENWAIISVFLTPDNKRKRMAGMIIKELRKKIKSPEGTKVFIAKRKMGPIQDKPITLHIISNDMEANIKAERKILNFLKTMKKMGVSDIDSDRKEGRDELVVNLNHRKMAAMGLSTYDVAQSLRTGFDGSIVTSIQTVDEEIQYRLILNKESRRKESVINRLSIKNNQGSLIPLKSFVNFTTRSADLAIYHRDAERCITISAEVNPKKITATEAAGYIKKNLLNKWDVHDMEILIGGEAQQAKLILGDIRFAVILALFLIFSIMAVVLDSLTQPLIIMSVIPFGLIGVLFALLLHGQNMSMFVLLALVSLTGIVVNDSIVMVNTLNKQIKSMAKKVWKNNGFYEVIADSAKTRLRPILLTTFTTLGGLFPMAYGLGGYEKMLSPMALALSWGLLFATIITLFLIPSLYVMIFKSQFKGTVR